MRTRYLLRFLLVELEEGQAVLDPRVEGLRAHHLHPVPLLLPRLRVQLIRRENADPARHLLVPALDRRHEGGGRQEGGVVVLAARLPAPDEHLEMAFHVGKTASWCIQRLN